MYYIQSMRITIHLNYTCLQTFLADSTCCKGVGYGLLYLIKWNNYNVFSHFSKLDQHQWKAHTAVTRYN